ncbi:DUF1643 domain-containing protein [Methylobacterium sp. R2-1]|uniref:DUF1643 domain-containing protein n=1 Tax=Methylobacterium sp. R2-1 TaxID=2587064 RepID=UPI00160BEDB7|nr:DUF1643 domain-containing protein [Methylobacterium sp. R2-1]MBB2962904.1 hypothetical protein [Methylobacterium sp. R2-1]
MSAIISPCGLYRYRLERDLGSMLAGPTVAWIMVNPSTADAVEDDHTIRKVIGFSQRLGAGRIIVGNLFAFRATDIKALRTAADPIGLDADQHLRAIFEAAERIIVAWGPVAKVPPHLRTRWRRPFGFAQALGRELMCLGTAQDGHPLHPLMLGYDRPLVPWSPPGCSLAPPTAEPTR